MLETTWFVLWGILWAIYFMLDGFDLGLGSLMPFLAKNDTEKRIIFNAMGPFWDGNEVWLITAGGVTFAAFPRTYAVMFSSLYSPLMIILFALILRGISFEFRGKLDSPVWRKIWDFCMVFGSLVPAFLFGVAFANIFKGIPIDQNGIFQGTILDLLNFYGIIGGFLFLLLFMVHGSIWLAIKSEGEQFERAASAASRLWIALLVVACLFLASTAIFTTLTRNYLDRPILFIIPLLAVIGLVLTRAFIGIRSWWKAWFASSLTIAGATLFGVIGLYPYMFPSSLDPSYGISIQNAASSPLTLKIMLFVVVIFVPIVIIYQAWVYNLFKGKVKEAEMQY